MQTASSGSNNTNSSSNSNKKCLIKTAIERIVVHVEETKTDTLRVDQKEEEQTQHKLQQDVTNVEYDIINYTTPPPPPPRPTSSLSSSSSSSSAPSIPRIAVTTPRPRQRSKQNPSSPPSQCQAVGQRCSRLNNNSSNNHSVLVEVDATSSHSPNIDVSAESVAVLTEEEHAMQTEEVERSPKILRCLEVDTAAEDQPIRSRGGGGAVHSRLRKPQATVQARSTAAAAATTATASVVGSNHHPNRHASPSPCSTLGVNMRVTGQCSQGGRKYMEDQFSVAYQESPLTHELEYAFFGIYDGHGGNEAALFAKEHLMLEIVKQKQFWSDNDEDVLRAIREGYIATHFAMWREQEKWPRTANGHLSTAGTTATVAFMRREKIYIGHVGDSGIVLGYQKKNERHWRAKQLTTDHKPESAAEKARIQRAGGNVAIKSGVPRVVWNRPRDPMHRGPIRRRTLVDDIPFLAVARSLGDLWSYNSRCKEFVVSPDPDVKVVKIDPKTFRCLIFGTDGLWNVVTPTEAVDSVRKKHLIGEILNEQDVMNPSKALVDQALKTWAAKKMRADNTSVVTVILTPATSNGSQSSNGASEVDMDMFLEAEDQADIDEDDEMDEDERLDRENSCPVELCIEEEEYVHDTPYSALAKRHLPPEPYRNFDYYGMDEDIAEGCGEDNNNGDDDDEGEEEVDDEDVAVNANNCDGAAAIVTVAATTMEVYDGQRMQQSLAIHRKLCRRSIVPTQNPSSNSPWASVLPEERQAEKEQERPMELDAEHNLSIFSDTSIDRSAIYDNASSTSSSVTSSSRVQVVRTDLDHSFSSYVANGGTAVSTDFSFAESYNTLLNEQEQEARNRSEADAAAAATTTTGGANAANGGGSTGVGVDVHRMHEIIQEQQLYQQQEGYSLTQLETRSEQLQLQQHQHQHQQQQEQQTNWTQPGELLELNALLQQEREEEEQVAREQMMEATSSSSRGEFGYAPDWSSRSTSTQLPGKEDNDSAEEKPDQMSKELSKEHQQQQKSFAESNNRKQSEPDPLTAPTLQDNEVSSTLPATPEPTPIHASTSAAQQLQETVAEIRKEDAEAVHYIFEQIQKLQQVDCTPVAAAPNVGEALERANALAGSQSVPLIRQMRRYRNVPNENHQHMQHMTRRRHQIFKSSKAKSFITASAAAIVAYSEREEIEAREESGAENRVKPDTAIGGGTKARAGSTSAGNNNNNKCNENGNVTSGGSSSTSVNRRRIVNEGANVSSASTSASSSSNMVMTRRSHSLVNTGVSKRQLRSSICNLGNLDLTKRTLRTRNVPAAMASTTSSSPSRSPAASSSTSNRSNNSFVSGVANTATTPRPAPAPTPTPPTPSNTATTTPANSSPSSRRLKRTKEEEREQRRSLRRTTLSASQLSARHHRQLHLPHHQLNSSSSSGGSGQFGRSTRLQPCSGGAISARPPPSPKKLNGAVPTLAIGTRAYTAALAAAADHLNKRWSLRSSSSSHTNSNSAGGGGGGTNTMGSPSSASLGGNSLMSAMTCYSPRNRNSSNATTTTTAPAATTRRR